MSDVYKIGMSIILADGVSSVLGKIASQMTGIEGQAKRIEAGLASWNKAVVGAVGVLGGAAVLGGLKNIADHGDKLLDQQDKMRRAGLQQNEVLKLQADYYEKIAKSVPTSTVSEYLKTVNELRAVTGSTQGAANLAERAMKVDALLGNTFNKDMSGEYYKLLRSAEMKGISTDPAKLADFTDKAFSYITAFGGKLSANDFQLLARRGGTAFMNADIDKAMGPLAVLAADLGGSGAGTTLMTLQQMQMGANTLSKQQGEILEKAGLLDMSKVTKTGFGGGRLQVAPGGILGSLSHKGDLPGWIKDVVYPKILAEAGGDDVLAQSLIAKMFPNRNAAKLVEMFGNPHFLDQQQKDLGLAGQVKPIDQAYADYIKNNPKGAKSAFNNQYESMMQSIGAPMMQAAIPVMKAVTDFFTTVGDFANKHPNDIANIGKGIAILGAALIGGGAVALLAALGPVGWFAAGIIALGATFVTFKTQISELSDSFAKFIPTASEVVGWMNSIGNSVGGFLEKIKNAVGGWFSHTSYEGGGEGGGLIQNIAYHPGGANDNFGAFRAISGGGSGNFGGAVSSAQSMVGAAEGSRALQNYLSSGGVGMDSATTAWCAGFVNAALAHAGIQGTGSLAAGSFANWGSAVHGGIMAGDILGHGKGWHGHHWGHVMMATGRTRGGLVEVIEGDSGHRVKSAWISPSGEQFIRRGMVPPASSSGAASGVGDVYLDGRKVGRHVERSISRRHAVPYGTNTHDGSAGYSPVDAVSI